ncbi:MAG: glycosyltransferase family 2 protein [Lachnospiraceae bacterium]|nr:glycosyltransferase family 2 protein [Lachnospiraceae bacterium]
MPLVSIIVPVYNVSQYLEKCILSIINQSIKNIEVILVDDGSTDNSGIICDKFLQIDSRIKVIHKQNGGLVTARKAGLRIASGKYIGFVDGDDYIALDMFEKLCDNLEETEADFVYSGIIINGNACDCLANDVIRIDDIDKNVNEYFLNIDSSKRMGATLCTKLFCSNIIKDAYEIVPDGQAVGEDSIATLECMFRCRKISLLNQAYYYYSIREDSITHMQNINKIVQETSLYTCMRSILEHYSCSSNTFYLLERWYLFRLWGKMNERINQDIPMVKYIYPKPNMLCGKKVVIYGAGTVGQGYYAQISCFSNCKVVAWIDKNYDKYNFASRKVENVQRLSSLKFDLLVIAVKNKDAANKIQQNLVNAGISEDKIIWETPTFILK